MNYFVRLLGLLVITNTVSSMEPAKKGPPNRLAKESSPYLLQHAYNPVDWYPWGPEAFAKAKKEGKLIFLSIGYSSCHWCHVMEKESFSNKVIADILNKHFVCIKVDREERPDIDELYMTALQVFGSRGGWPLSMFITDSGKPIVGGTYFPPEDKKVDGGTIRGFKGILEEIQKLNIEKRKELLEQADEVAKLTVETLTNAHRANPLVELNRELAAEGALLLQEAIDPEFGGIGNPNNGFRGTKFPMPPTLRYLLREAYRTKNADLQKLVNKTLTKMAQGGIYDQLGGGFHRYSTDRTWTVPHFEKMLYDNAQLIELYSEAYEYNPNQLYKQVVQETIAFVARELTAPPGGFYSALDADSEGEEGEFYIWTPAQIETALNSKDDALFIRAVYSITGNANFENRAYVLQTIRSADDIAKEQKLTLDAYQSKVTDLKAKLFAARAKRERPFLDTKILTAWNGMMIRALVQAGVTFKEPTYTAMAAKAADFLLQHATTKDFRLKRSTSIDSEQKVTSRFNAYLDDYALFADALFELHQVTNEAKWLEASEGITKSALKWFGEEQRGGFYYTSSDHEELFARTKDYSDGVTPSSNGVLAQLLLKMGRQTKQKQYTTAAEGTIKQFAGVLKIRPTGVPTLALALDDYLTQGAAAPEVPKQPLPKNNSPTKSSEVVAVVVTVKKIADSFQYRIKLTIQPGWYLYANDSGAGEAIGKPTAVRVLAVDDKSKVQIKYPAGKPLKPLDPKAALVYQEIVELEISSPVKLSEANLRLEVQACQSGDAGVCLLPETIRISVPD
ncbi:MAG: DUF255 domain-containing protein [Zavarzinella sp.]